METWSDSVWLALTTFLKKHEDPQISGLEILSIVNGKVELNSETLIGLRKMDPVFFLLFSLSLGSDILWLPWTAAYQASQSITKSWSLLKLISIKSLMPSNHFILCPPLLLPPSIFVSTRMFSNGSVLRIRWPKYWNFSFSISPSNEYSGLIS